MTQFTPDPDERAGYLRTVLGTLATTAALLLFLLGVIG